ncbi:MAG TPA: asparagine synthase (glutamine-hydrolyzing) [Chitinophagaceae bacterium]|nr:asparagine synthase (glutamine-hydrolyzing) [Chitinophagaceae bacterium]
MCGIAGILQANISTYNKEQLAKMTGALAHRGPDGEGLWQNETGNVLLGHRRLSIIDLSDSGRQPMHYQDRYTIIHNGEIYNYIELKEELQKKGYAFHSQTDTEVITAAYDCWKDDCVNHFDGMFAFAIWDEKNRVLFAARDRFGEKPFFYFFNGQDFLFASEMKALWAAGVAKIPNQKMLFNFITIGYVDNPARPEETFYENIYKLPPACRLKYSGIYLNYSVVQYWDIDLTAKQKNSSDADVIEQFIHLFSQSVKKRLRSDVPVGSSLSGGLDSSSIAAISYEMQNSLQSHKCFTASFANFEKDETVFSKQVAAQFNLEQYTTAIAGNELLEDWETLCYHQEEPFGSASIFAQYKVFELAGQHNIKVLLDGQGADETLAGYHKYYKWYWQELFRKRKLYKNKELDAAHAIGINENFDYKNMIAAYFPVFASVVMERQYLLKAIRQEDLDKEFVQLQSKEAYYTPPEHFDLNGVLYFNTCTHGLEELLRYADRNAMAHGREVRLPFLSHELVEFIFSLPSHFKIRHGWTKWLLREAMKDKLPAPIVWRKDKIGFEPPQKLWLEQPAMQEAIQEAKRKLVNEKVLKKEVLNKKITALAAHDTDNYDWRYFSAASIFK